MALQSCATHIHKYVWNSHVFPAPCKDSKYKKAAFWAGLLHIGNLGIASSLMASRNCPSIIPLLTTIFFCWEKSFVGPLIQKKMTWGQLVLSAQTLCEFPENRKYVMAKSTLSSCSRMGAQPKNAFFLYSWCVSVYCGAQLAPNILFYWLLHTIPSLQDLLLLPKENDTLKTD